MPSPNDVLVENVRETYRRIERLIILALSSSAWLIVVAEISPIFADTTQPIPPLPMLGFSAGSPLFLFVSIAVITYVVAGLLMLLYYRGANNTKAKLQEGDADLAEAIDTYPSVMTLPRPLRSLAFAGVSLVGIFALVVTFATPDDTSRGRLPAFILSIPYIVLFLHSTSARTRRSIGGS